MEELSMARTKSTEPHVVLSFRLPKQIIERVDKYADRETRTRINMVTVLLQEALARRDKR
jgi:predicted transcriptional regulator